MFTPEEELDALRLLVSAKYKCDFEQFLINHMVACEQECPIRDLVLEHIRKEFSEQKMERYYKEYPDDE
jgi:hypothetical protein